MLVCVSGPWARERDGMEGSYFELEIRVAGADVGRRDLDGGFGVVFEGGAFGEEARVAAFLVGEEPAQEGFEVHEDAHWMLSRVE